MNASVFQNSLLGFGLQIEGLEMLYARLNRMQAVAGDPFTGDVPKKIRDRYTKIISRQFKTQGEGDWPELSPMYAARKSSQYPGRPMLIASGEMHQALTNPSDPDFVFEHNGKQITLGSNDEKAAWHHSGAGDLPERRLYIIDEAFAEGVAEDVAESMFSMNSLGVL